MRARAEQVLLVLASALGCWLLLEGAWSLVRGNDPGTSLVYALLDEDSSDDEAERLAEGDQGLPGYVLRERDLEQHFEGFAEGGVVIGNSPYDFLATAEARVTRDDPVVGRRFKPNLTVRTAHFRSRIFKHFDPLSYSYIVRPGRSLRAETRAFLEDHRLREVIWTTDAQGFRTTLPRRDVDPVVVFVGSSPCAGPFLEDGDTLPSLLQRGRSDLRIVNACVNKTSVENHAAMTAELAAGFEGRLAGAIYTLNSKNFDAPEEAIAAVDRIADLLDDAGADYRVLVYFHYIYETLPDLYRKRRDLAQRFAVKRKILDHARGRGFAAVDTVEMVDRYRVEQGSLFSGMALYLDHGHLSREGTRVLAAAIPPLP